MSDITCPEVRTKEAGETVNVLLAFDLILDKDNTINETISSITSVAATGLTISGSAVTTAARALRKDDGSLERYVPAGKAITFIVAGGTNLTDYAIKAIVVTSGGQTRVRYCTMQVRAS